MGQCGDTIIAQCTARGAGAIALVRLSGPQAWQLAERSVLLSGGKRLSEQESHTVHFGRAYGAGGELIDQVMVIALRGPRTFTGEDVVEITCHNNQYIIDQLIGQLCASGARMAAGGEFARRAVEQGKIDLIQAEAINELIKVQTGLATKRALAQVEGSLSRQVAHLVDELVAALAWCNASFEFLDDEGDFIAELSRRCVHIRSLLAPLQGSRGSDRYLRSGVRIALIGAVNAGKSSLLNALLGYQRAIVSAQAGTTRDTIESVVVVDGIPWTFIDTAGIRETADLIEQEGIKRSQSAAALSDLVIYVIDGARGMSDDESVVYQAACRAYQERLITVLNKSDLTTDAVEVAGAVHISAYTGRGMVQLRELMQKKITEIMKIHDTPFLLNERQLVAVHNASEELAAIEGLLAHAHTSYELIACHLRASAAYLDEVTGKTISEASMDTLFKQFCVGK